MRREVPTMIGFFFGAMMVADYFVGDSWKLFGAVTGDVQQWALIVVAFAYVLGGVNIFRIHSQKIARKARDWQYSIVTLVSLVVVLFCGLLPIKWWPGEIAGGMEAGSPLLWIYDATYTPLGATVYSLLAFFIASASYRAFRIRNWHAASLAITAIIVMAGAVPLTAAVLSAISPSAGAFMTELRSWIMDVLQNAGKRAILIGVALGTIATGFKIILGIERPYGRE